MNIVRTAIAIVFAAVLLMPSLAGADSLLILLSHSSIEPESAEPGDDSFWWETTTPSLTEFDHALNAELVRRGVDVAVPEDLSRVSRIYRKATLSDSNAGALAGILGARHVLVGSVQTQKLEPLRPLMFEGVRIQVTAHLLRRLPDGSVSAPRSVEIERIAFGDSPETAMQIARLEVFNSLGQLIEKATRTGVSTGQGAPPVQETLVGLRGISNARLVDRVRSTLSSHSEVKSTSLSWLAPGLVAIELNPDVVDADETVRRIVTETASRAEFDIRLVAIPSEIDGLIEFRVEESAPPQ